MTPVPDDLNLDALDVPDESASAEAASPSSGQLEHQEVLFQEVAEELAEREALAIADASQPAADAFPAADLAQVVHQAVDRLSEQVNQRLAGLQAQFDREIRAESNRERIVDRLHAELQEYKQDLLLKVQRPIFIDLIQLHDDVGKMAQTSPGDETAEAGASVRGILESIQTAIEDILYRQGVEPFRNEGEAFDPRRQRAVTTVPTEESDLAKTVANRLRPGFQGGDKIIRPELVTVYTLKK